jgi:hypothetical protein
MRPPGCSERAIGGRPKSRPLAQERGVGWPGHKNHQLAADDDCMTTLAGFRDHPRLGREPGRSILIGLFVLSVAEMRTAHHAAVLIGLAKWVGLLLAAYVAYNLLFGSLFHVDWDAPSPRARLRTPSPRLDTVLVALFIGLVIASLWVPWLFRTALVVGGGRTAAGLAMYATPLFQRAIRRRWV